MLQNDPFYWGSIYKLVVAFGAVFSDIHICRFDQAGNVIKIVEVPCEFGPKEKYVHRNTQDPMPTVSDQAAMVLPRIAYDFLGGSYDASRKLTSTGRVVRTIQSNKGDLKTQFNPVPWNFNFELNVMTKLKEDGLQIVEQIFPFFTPDYTITLNDMPDMGVTKEIPIVLNSSVHSDTWTGQLTERREILWTLQFTMKGYIYPPTKVTKVILESDINVDNTYINKTVPKLSTDNATTVISLTDTQIVQRQQNIRGVCKIVA